MKKILLIIALTLCIFQMVALATAIDIGVEAISRSDGITETIINKGNPANATGTITSVEIYAYYLSMDNVEVATFYEVSENHFTTRDSEVIGAVTTGAKRTFVVSLDVVAGDYIGLYVPSGYLAWDASGGDGIWVVGGDNIPCTNTAFGFNAGNIVSVYGTGVTEEEEEDNAIFFGFNF